MAQVAVAREEVTATERPSTDHRFQRLWEVDAWRGVAIVMMVVFHLMYDLWAFGGREEIVLYRGFWFYFQRATAGSFILLVGISLVISYNRALAQRGSAEGLFWKFLRRGLRIFAVGMGLTAAVWFAGAGRIDFGILHLIGASVVLAYPFLRYRWANVALGLALNGLAEIFQGIKVPTYGLVWLGLEPPNYVFLDYFPLVPWFGLVLIGIALGNTLYPDGQRAFVLPDWGRYFPLNLLRFLGRHSLLIYVVHQPVLIAVLAALGIIQFPI